MAALSAAPPVASPVASPTTRPTAPLPRRADAQVSVHPLVHGGTLSRPRPSVSHLDIQLLQAPTCEQTFMVAPSHAHGAFGTVSYAQSHACERFLAKTVFLESSPEQAWSDVSITPTHAAQREVRIAHMVPGAITSVAAITTGDRLVHVMQLMDGNWTQLPKSDPPATMLTRSLEGFSQSARGLASFHRQDVLHGDIKLENLLWTKRNVVKWGDYGVSRWLDPDGGLLRGKRGTPFAMAPEVIGGQTYDRSADMWSFGIALGEMFVGSSNSVFRGLRTQANLVALQQSVVSEIGKLRVSRLLHGTTPMHQFFSRWYVLSPQTCRFALEELFLSNPQHRATSARASNVANKAVEAAPNHVRDARRSMAALSVSALRENTFGALDEAWRAVRGARQSRARD